MKNWAIYAIAGLGFLAYNMASNVDRDASGAIVGEGNVDAFEVRVGDCFDDTDAFNTEINSVPGVPCSEPHDNEAFAVFGISLASYPQDEAMADLALDECKQRFDVFVGKDYASSSLDIMTMYPSEESWKQNDREVICAVYNMDASKLHGSSKGRAL
jgi:hypothetical protein